MIFAIYNKMIEDLQARILANYPSVKVFCEKNNISRQNLCRVFNTSQVMSLDLYIRICVALGVLAPGSNLVKGHFSSMTLEDYLSIQSDIVLSVLVLSYELEGMV